MHRGLAEAGFEKPRIPSLAFRIQLRLAWLSGTKLERPMSSSAMR